MFYQNQTSPVQHLLKVYVYDNLPSHLSVDVEDKIEKDLYNSNWNTDLALIRLFRTFPGRTFDPEEADIFVVPYPHMAHCMTTPGYGPECRQLPKIETKNQVFSSLKYYNSTTADRHLFILSDSSFMSHPWIFQQPLVALYGPRWDHIGKKYNGPYSPRYVEKIVYRKQSIVANS
jgi:hypothetical protein